MKRSPFNLLLVASFVIAALIALPVVSVLANIFSGGTGATWQHLASTVLPDRPAWMGLPVPMARREMTGLRVPKARRGRRVPMALPDLKAHPEPMDSREDRLAPKGPKARPAWMALKGRLERMAPKVRRGR